MIAVISWMAGLLYLPRIFVYHSQNKKNNEPGETFKKSGFELYDEIFDYAFDLDENKNTRLDDILLQIKHLNSLNYSELIDIVKTIQPKIDHNFNHLYTLDSKNLEKAHLEKNIKEI